VPACAADALRVERGEEPTPRELQVGGRMVPYYDAGPLYSPFYGGYFGGFGGFLPGLFLGEALSGWGDPGPDVVYVDDGPGGDWGDFGGGDFDSGGGDFDSGGGDFDSGGGDFDSGGGDFGGGDF
jgi:hypothetical protein